MATYLPCGVSCAIFDEDELFHNIHYFSAFRMHCFCLFNGKQLFDDVDPPQPIWLPPSKDLIKDKALERQVQHVLEAGMERGLYFRVKNNSIIASRFCK
jgi:hypothetical protein